MYYRKDPSFTYKNYNENKKKYSENNENKNDEELNNKNMHFLGEKKKTRIT